MTSSTLTSHQVDLIKTAAAIIFVIDDSTLHPALRQTTPLTPDQIALLAHRFSDGLDRWDREVKAKRGPSSVDMVRIAIAADLLSQRYPGSLKRDNRGEITIPVSDIVDSWNHLSGDMTRYAESRARWEENVRSIFGPEPGSATASRFDQPRQAAEKFGQAVANSLGIGGLFNNELVSGDVPQAEVPPLPTYAATDPRSQELPLLGKLQLELSVTEGLLAAITPDEPDQDHHHHFVHWVQKRTNLAIDRVTGLVVPSGISNLSKQLSDTEKVLKQSRDLLRTCLYGEEAQLAADAAQHAVERSLGTILFLAVCPNIPFVLPTLELRITITKPLLGVTRGAHMALGKIPIFGFLFLMLRWVGEAIDAIPRFQVRFVQGIVSEGWLGNSNKRAKLIKRYLRYADRRATKPKVDALQRVLLSIVS